VKVLNHKSSITPETATKKLRNGNGSREDPPNADPLVKKRPRPQSRKERKAEGKCFVTAKSVSTHYGYHDYEFAPLGLKKGAKIEYM
jgi:hypothetical protein